MRGVEQIPWLYDLGMALLEASGLSRWRQWLVAEGSGRLLDLGCGTGRNLALLDGRVRAVGVDRYRPLLLKARQRAPGAWLVQARAESLPFRDAVFDSVTSGLVFCSVADPAAGLSEVRRVLRPAGTLRMLEHVRSEHALQARLQDLGQPLWTWFTGGCRPNRATEASVQAAGFRIDPATRRAAGNLRRFVACPPEAGTASVVDDAATAREEGRR